MTVAITFEAIAEDQPGPQWQALFRRLWPGYRDWYVRGGQEGRLPGFVSCRRALRDHMPELVPTWERLVELAGGGDLEARFLSMWCPPRYITGCSQGVWIDPAGRDEPALLRNYDYAPLLLEGNWLATAWTGQRVVAMNDCLWGALDGVNGAGLAASLSFGGRTVDGPGFGVPLVLRYLLEVATTVGEAVAILRRVPVSMTYNITLLDAASDWATVLLAPDRPVEVTRWRAITNFQHRPEWPAHARATHAAERLGALRRRVDPPAASLAYATAGLLQPPLYQLSWLRGYGTLYSTVYRPVSRRAELLWPDRSWPQSVDRFEPGRCDIVCGGPGPAPAADVAIEAETLIRLVAGSRA